MFLNTLHPSRDTSTREAGGAILPAPATPVNMCAIAQGCQRGGGWGEDRRGGGEDEVGRGGCEDEE